MSFGSRETKIPEEMGAIGQIIAVRILGLNEVVKKESIQPVAHTTNLTDCCESLIASLMSRVHRLNCLIKVKCIVKRSNP